MINPWLSHILSHIKPILTMVFLCPWFSTTPAALAPSRLQELSERLFVALRQGPGLRSVQFFGLPQSPTKIEILRFITIFVGFDQLGYFWAKLFGGCYKCILLDKDGKVEISTPMARLRRLPSEQAWHWHHQRTPSWSIVEPTIP